MLLSSIFALHFFALLFILHPEEKDLQSFLEKKYKLVLMPLFLHTEKTFTTHRPHNAIDDIDSLVGNYPPSQHVIGGMGGSFGGMFPQSPDQLASLAPIVMVMYCFNQAPQLTMMMLTGLMMYVLGST